MQNFVIPGWVWLNAGILVAAAGYVALRLSREGRRPTARAPAPAEAYDLDPVQRQLKLS